MPSEKVIETDVLVVGGGMAGLFAAIKAKEQGVDVTLVDKGYAGKSGQTPFAGSFVVFNLEWGDDLDAWVEQISRYGEYVNNRVWTELTFKESYARYQDLVSWGVEFNKMEDGDLFRTGMRFGPCRSALTKEKIFPELMRKEAVKRGIKIMDRVMVTDLLKQDSRIVGATGFPMGSYDTYIFKAGAVVLCTGAGGFKPWGWPIQNLTFDGDAMAYRAGSEITGMEFPDTHGMRAENPAYKNFASTVRVGRTHRPSKMYNAEGNEVEGVGTLFLESEFEAHAGRAPVYRLTDEGNKSYMLGGSSSGMSVHKAEGIWPADIDCSTSLLGLYAAGDSLGNMQMGAAYSAIGNGLGGSAVTGAIAGVAAAYYTKSAGKIELDPQETEKAKSIAYAPLERKGGFSPRWVTQVLQNTVMPYYMLYIKKEDRMQAGLTIVEFLRDHIVPKLFARDPHDMRLALETKNMVLLAEMRFRASLFRKESRGCHFREDYPYRDDQNWLAWVCLKEENGEMKTIKKPIPKEWWPDLSKPYEELHPWRYPGEHLPK